jgi:hypothetical protein
MHNFSPTLTPFALQCISLLNVTVVTKFDLKKSRSSSLHNILNYSLCFFQTKYLPGRFIFIHLLPSVPKEVGQVSWSCKPTDLKLFVCISKLRYYCPWLVTSGTSNSKEMYLHTGSRQFLASGSTYHTSYENKPLIT